MGDQFIKVFVTTEGLEYLEQALKEGRGILLMAPHIGNPHIGILCPEVDGVWGKEPHHQGRKTQET